MSRCCPKRHVSRALRHGGEEGCERKGGIVRPHPSNLDGWDGERRRGMTGAARGWLQQSLGYTKRFRTGFDSGLVGLYVPRGYPLGTEVFAREIYRRRPGGFIVTAALEGIVNPRLRIADTKFYVGH